MVKLKRPGKPALELRLKAEARFRERPAPPKEASEQPTVEAFQRTFYELQIHQIELEMQFVELCRIQSEVESLRAGDPDKPMPGEAKAAGPRVSSREKQIISLVGDGNTSREISEILGISPRTVETHRWRIMQKLAIANGPSLVKYAMTNKIDRI